MGDYRVTLELSGGHGCQREVKNGGRVHGCRRMDCPDCVAVEFVDRMKAIGQHVAHAELVHWPGTSHTVVDKIIPSDTSVASYTTREGQQFHYVQVDPAHRIRSGSFE